MPPEHGYTHLDPVLRETAVPPEHGYTHLDPVLRDTAVPSTSVVEINAVTATTARQDAPISAKIQNELYKPKLENVAIAMHCDLRPPDAATVLIRFNSDVHAKSDVAHPPVVV